MYDYVNMGYWLVLPYSAVRHMTPLRLAPAGVVPQRERRPRPIMDYSFYDTNQQSVPIQPAHAMQFGGTLQRILQRLVYCNPTYGPPLMAKLDLADGYYRVPLAPQAALQLAVVTPNDHDDTFLVALPLSLPMGWGHSPPWFCAFTETIADVSNNQWLPAQPASLHTLLQPSQAHNLPSHDQFHASAITLGTTTTPPLAYTDVYIDDFLAVAQPPLHLPWLNYLLTALDQVFVDLPTANRRQVISASKLDKGDACYSTFKRILGWDIDTHKMILTLPKHRLQSLQDLLHMLMPKRRVSRKIWHKLLGILRSSTPAIYGAQHLFSLLQYALTHTKGRIRMTQLLRAVLTAWLELATDASSLPTPIMTVVPRCPTIYAATDASKAGMGGFWVSHSPDGTPQFTAWRSPFSAHIQERLVTADNTTGTITNNDLELTALIVGASLAAAAAAHQHPHIAVATDNTSACAWASKGSTTTGKAPAYLLHTLTQLRRHRPFTLLPLYTSGDTNTLADCCSRSFHLSDAELLAHLNAMYP
jgi:hypothetical protein